MSASASCPAASSTKAQGVSPHFSSGRATTAATATAEELIAWCKQHLAGYKVPRHVMFEELPKTSTGKIQKHVLRGKAKGG